MPAISRGLMSTMALGLGLLTACAGQRTNFPVGEIVTPGNTQVPLPPGEWKLLASDSSTGGSTIGGGTNNLHSIREYYAKIDHGRIVQLLFVGTSAGTPSDYGYGTGRDCLRAAPSDYVYFSDPSGGSLNAIDCVKVTGNRGFNPPGQTSTPLYRRAFESAKAYGGLPRYAVQVEIAEAHSLRFQDYNLYFFTEQTAAATRSANWRVDDMTPANRQFVDGVIGWAKGFRDAVRLGTQYRL